MGDRISIRFVQGENKSPYLFSHWGGQDFLKEAQEYIKQLRNEMGDKGCTPLERLEPETVMVDFIRAITRNMDRVTGDLYLCSEENEGDNGDNGHYDIGTDK